MRAIAAVLGAALAAAPAAATEELAKKHACFACHAVDKKMVGPSYREVAAKYRNDKAAPARLAEKVRQGSQGAWGNVPMPPNSAVPDADAQALARWILSQN